MNEVIDQDIMEDIYAFFQEAETDDIAEAIEELSEYEESEVRLVRIKFLSDMAN